MLTFNEQNELQEYILTKTAFEIQELLPKAGNQM